MTQLKETALYVNLVRIEEGEFGSTEIYCISLIAWFDLL